MKSIEKIVGVNISDLKTAIPAIKDLYGALTRNYLEKTHPKLKILDQLIVFSLITFTI